MSERRHLYGTRAAFVSVDIHCLECGGTGLRVDGGKQIASVHVCKCLEIITGHGVSKSHTPKPAKLPLIAEPEEQAQ